MKKHILLITLTFISFSVLCQNSYWKKPSPYQANWVADGLLLGGGYGLVRLAAHVDDSETYDTFVPGSFTQEDIDKINSFDRSFAGNWNMAAKDAGKIFKTTSKRIVPATLLLLPGSVKSRGKLIMMYYEGRFLAGSAVAFSKGSTGRYRPFAYLNNEQIDALTGEAKEEFWEDIVDDDLQDSFFSGDAAATAYGLTFFAKVFNDYYPESKYRKWVWGASIAGTTAGAYFRAKSGKHFPTDVIVGSAIGGAFGYFIPHFHKKRGDKGLKIEPTGNGLSLTYKLK